MTPEERQERQSLALGAILTELRQLRALLEHLVRVGWEIETTDRDERTHDGR